MFILMLKYIKPLEEVDKEVNPHREYLDKFYSSQKFIFSGRSNPRTGGIILCNAKDKNEVQSIIEQDPFYIKKIAEYEVFEFLPTKCAPGLERFINE